MADSKDGPQFTDVEFEELIQLETEHDAVDLEIRT